MKSEFGFRLKVGISGVIKMVGKKNVTKVATRDKARKLREHGVKRTDEPKED